MVIRISRIQSNIYDEVFLQKYLTAIAGNYFLQKSSIVDLRLDSKYESGRAS